VQRAVVVDVMTSLVNVYTLRVAMSLWTGLNFCGRERVRFAVARPRYARIEVAVLCVILADCTCVGFVNPLTYALHPDGVGRPETVSALLLCFGGNKH